MVQTTLARIPLIISFPTIILSGNLIVPTYQDILQLHLAHKHSNEHIGQTHFLLGDTVIRMVFLPLFLSQIFAFIGCSAHIISKKWSAVIPIVLTALVVSQLNFVLDPIQTTIFTAVTIKQLINSETRGVKHTPWKAQLVQFISAYFPLIGLSLVINCTNDKTKDLVSYIFDEDSWYYLPFYVLLYIILIGALRYTYPLFKSRISDDSNEPQANGHRADQELGKSVMPTLFLGSFASLSTIFILNFFYSSSDIQLLMIFVFLGCVTIFYFSLKDSLIDNYQRQVDPNIENAPISTLEIPNYMILLVGLMSVTLQYLSFNTVASSKVNDLLTVIFVVTAEVVARFSTSKTASRFVSGSSRESNEKKTPLTIIELPHQERSILKQIVLNKDTRSIFSFLLLNTTFMLVQLLYSFRSKSLGLLSDSLHMALDCMSLFLGLLATVLSKRPAGDKFPFRLKYLETLAGFTNGILLLGIVSGVFVEAIGRLFSGAHIEETNELLVVAILGLLVNLVGLVSFDHTGGDHAHGDGSADGDNMRGIFLHILADTLGSVGVILSTILIKLTNLHIFDSIASIMIASLILVSTLPLLKSTTQSLLMKLDDRKHNNVKNALNQITTTPGITGYTTPRFWPTQPNSSGHSHNHGGASASPEAAHSHDHNHSHSHQDEHRDQHTHNDEHSTEHSHEHVDENSHRHSESHGHVAMSKNVDNCSLVGYIHVQYNEGENSTIIKKRVEKILEDVGIHAWVQVEPQNSNCWCRATSMSSVMNSSTINPRQNGITFTH